MVPLKELAIFKDMLVEHIGCALACCICRWRYHSWGGVVKSVTENVEETQAAMKFHGYTFRIQIVGMVSYGSEDPWLP